jgi:hypothetical protein
MAQDESNKRPILQALGSLLAAGTVSVLLSGCAATQVALEHKSLDVQTRMSQTLFLEAEKPADRTVLLEIKNTSDKPVEVAGPIRQRLEAKGYRVVNSPNEAYYILQVNVRQVAKASPSALSQSRFTPADSAAAGAALASAFGASMENFDGPGQGAAIGEVAAKVADLVAGAFVHNVTYRMITDLQILERTDGQVNQTVSSDLHKGSGTRVLQTNQSIRERRKYQTQIVSTANKVNLNFDKALQLLEDNLARSIAGIM